MRFQGIEIVVPSFHYVAWRTDDGKVFRGRFWNYAHDNSSQRDIYVVHPNADSHFEDDEAEQYIRSDQVVYVDPLIGYHPPPVVVHAELSFEEKIKACQEILTNLSLGLQV